ncbi:MAG TPA: aspartate aminotransferase family protein [Alphaproteobacteria bacterium]|nr:aspartate aminotransferase family protein [Alphaproteobacteria bacterium]
MIPALMPTYARANVAFERGEGAYLYASDGRRYLDFACGIGVTGLGHAHPHLVKALTEQGKKLWHCSNIFQIPGQQRLAERLVARSFADTVFFCNSGAEAIEGGIKLVRKYHDDSGHPERYRIITFHNGFHGRTLATIAAGGQEKHLKGFAPVVDGFDHVAYENLNEVRAAITAETAAILVEPVQGEGGLRAARPEFLKSLRQVCDEFGLLLFLDEVQCGMGRTGKLFAHEWAGIKPDVLSTAKALGGGFPIGALLATEKAAVGMTAGTHGSTFGGNPLAMAVANAVLDVMFADGFLDQVAEKGERLGRRLTALVKARPRVFSELRGMGLMRGLKCVDGVTAADIVARLRDRGLLTVGSGDNVVRIMPPLIVEDHHMEEAVAILEGATEEIEPAKAAKT